MRSTVLTERQIEVLKLKVKGLSTSEIAKLLGTSVANVSATEKKAKENIQRAKDTLKLVRMLEAPLNVSIAPDEDLNDAVRDIYRKADEAGIWISRSFPSLTSLISRAASEKIRGRRVLREIEVAVTRDGEVIVI